MGSKPDLVRAGKERSSALSRIIMRKLMAWVGAV